MGCITSRDKWPPEPKKRFIVRWKEKIINGQKVLVESEDYVIDWPALRGGGGTSQTEDTGPWQQDAIRSLEGD